MEPSKIISDQYRLTVVATLDGEVITGRVTSEDDKKIVLIEPGVELKSVEISKDDIEEMAHSDKSEMPDGLLATLNEDEALDLFAYLLSRGNPKDLMFSMQ